MLHLFYKKIVLNNFLLFFCDAFLESRAKYNEGEVNIHYKTPIRREEKEFIPEDELRKRQEDQVRGHSYTTYYVKKKGFLLPKLF